MRRHVEAPFCRLMEPPVRTELEAPRAAALPRLAAACGIALAVGLTVLHPSTTRIQAWPWAAFAVVGWSIPIAAVVVMAFRRSPLLGLDHWADRGFCGLSLAILASALASPFRELSLASALPVLAACALPYALRPCFEPRGRAAAHEIAGVLVIVVLVASAALWLRPWDWQGWPAARNDYPFGHGNTVGSVAVLAATWLAATAARATGRSRVVFATGAVLAAGIVVSSASRGAALALAAAACTAAALHFARRGRLGVFALIAVAVIVAAVGTNERLRDLVLHQRWSASSRESNDQRSAMLMAGARLGAERPLLGWGPGTVPHVFPRVRADLPGSADNVVQLHNSPLQLWATLGLAGLLGFAMITIGLLRGYRSGGSENSRLWLAAGLVGGSIVVLTDHPFDVPAFAVLAALHVSDWFAGGTRRPGPRTYFGWLWLAAAVPVFWVVARDLQGRAAYAAALDRAGADDRAGYVAELQRASTWVPTDPYYRHQLAAHLVTGHPWSEAQPAEASRATTELEASLRANPDSEYAHYNLGWLRLEAAPREAAAHFLRAAQLAPQRGSVYFGLGLARLREGDRTRAVRAFATEFLNDPAFAWAPLWREGPLAALRPEIMQAALSAELPPALGTERLHAAWRSGSDSATVDGAYRRVRIGYGVLMGHPDGPPPVDFNVQLRLVLPRGVAEPCPSKGWLRGDILLKFLDGGAK